MNWDRVQGNWKQLKGKVQEQWGREQLVGRIQERYGIAKDEAERQVDSWTSTH